MHVCLLTSTQVIKQIKYHLCSEQSLLCSEQSLHTVFYIYVHTYCLTGGLAVVVRAAHCTFRATAQNSNFTLSEQQTKPTHGLRVGSWEDDFQKTFHDIKCCPVLVSGLYR